MNLLQTLRADYVEAARARGIKERWVVRRHAFRNALIPVVTAIGLQIAALLSGSVLTETTFEWQGIGYTTAQYLRSVDFIAVQGIVTAYRRDRRVDQLPHRRHRGDRRSESAVLR